MAGLVIGAATAATAAAEELWRCVYPELSADRPGLVGAATARAEAQVRRLAMIHALLDGHSNVDAPHLEAAIALWDFADEPAQFIWSNLLGDPVADAVLQALRAAGANGKTRTELHYLFGRNRPASEINRALTRADTGGRPSEAWVAITTGG